MNAYILYTLMMLSTLLFQTGWTIRTFRKMDHITRQTVRVSGTLFVFNVIFWPVYWGIAIIGGTILMVLWLAEKWLELFTGK